MLPKDIISFWFEELESAAWWKKDDSLDTMIRERFESVWQAAKAGELWDWRTTAEGRLAEIIVLDQFSRNMFRGTPSSFAQDPIALVLAQEALGRGADQQLPENQRDFMYMPYMHSESKTVQIKSIEVFSTLESKGNLNIAVKHKAIIDRFARYPHRNEILGRLSTPGETEFLQQPGSSF